MTPDLADRIRLMPKAELHLHLEGAFRWSTVQEYVPEARARGARPPWIDQPFENFDDFRAIFRNFLLPATGTAERVERHFFEVLEDLAAQNARYVEPLFYPPMHMATGLPVKELLDAARRGIERAERAYPIACRLILGLSRGPAAAKECDLASEILEIAGPRGSGLIAGLDVMNDDRMGIVAPFTELYREAATQGLRLRVHAGELGGPEVVRDALDRLGATHLSHGIGAVQDSQLLAALAANGTWFHVCPTSNVRLGAAPDFRRHPLRMLLDAGCNVTLNSDDPLLFGRNITDEFLCAAGEMKLSRDDIERLALSAFRASLLPQDERLRFEAELKALFV